MIVGDSRPYLSALLVLNPEQWELLAKDLNLDPTGAENCKSSRISEVVLERVAKQISAFPGYAKIRKVCCQIEPWDIENGLMTPTLKIKRSKIIERFEADIEKMYQDH